MANEKPLPSPLSPSPSDQTPTEAPESPNPSPFRPLLDQFPPSDDRAALLARIATLEAQTANTPARLIGDAKAAFTVPAGEEGYVHALVTHKNGVAVDFPRVEPFHPAVYRSLAKVEGFTAEVLHNPATVPAESAPAI